MGKIVRGGSATAPIDLYPTSMKIMLSIGIVILIGMIVVFALGV